MAARVRLPNMATTHASVKVGKYHLTRQQTKWDKAARMRLPN